MKKWLIALILLFFLIIVARYVFLPKFTKKISVSNQIQGCILYEQGSNKLVDLIKKIELYELGVRDFALANSMKETIKETCRQGGCRNAFVIKDFELVEVILTKEAQPYHQKMVKDGKVVESDFYSVDSFKDKRRLKIWVQVNLDLIRKYTKRSEYSNEINKKVAEALYGLAGNRMGSTDASEYWPNVKEFFDGYKNNYNFFGILCL